MPELPEVETSKKGIAPFCEGQTIVEARIRTKKLRWPLDPDLAKYLKGRTVQAVNRRGKYLLIEFDKNGRPGSLMIHLGMSGSLRVIDANLEAAKHDHFDLVLSNGKAIRLNDPRRFGSIIWNTESLTHPLLSKLGPEPLNNEFDADYLYAACQKRKAAIKQVIMDSKVVVGVGNIYAQESLFMAGIHPTRAANRVSKKRISELVLAIKDVLAEAIKAGGSSLKDFTKADGKPGYFQHTFQVYGRAGEECNICQTILKHKQLGQRTSTYCPFCQK